MSSKKTKAKSKPKPKRFKPMDAARRQRIWAELSRLYPDTSAPLDHKSNFQLLVSVVLSAQTTDVAVNKLTPALFKAYPDAKAMAAAPLPDIEDKIRTIGLFRNKAKFLKELSQQLLEDFGGVVPDDQKALTSLAGVGDKTAQVVLYHAFDKPGLAVDTHVHRLANRIGLANSTSAPQTERQLKQQFEPEDWGAVSIRIIWHGRRVCDARKPDCEHCTLREDCAYGRKAG